MSLNAATIRLMIAKGLSAEDIADIAESMEVTADNRSSAAKRQARYRNAKRNERDVTRDVTPPPNDNISNPPGSVTSSDEEDNGDFADPAKIIFDAGVSLITKSGKSANHARSWLGKKRKEFGDSALIAAIGNAKREGAIDPIPWMEKVLRRTAGADSGGVWV